MAMKVVGCLVVMCMVVAAPYAAEATISCGQVDGLVGPCIPYLKGTSPLSPRCCPGVSKLNSLARNTPDRQAVCRCLVAASKTVSGLKTGLAAGLPARCGVRIPYKIDPATDCSKVH